MTNKRRHKSHMIELPETEFFDTLPVRTEIEVLPADDCKQLKLGWVVHEVNGGEVWFANDENEAPITTINGIKVGDVLMVPTLVGVHQMTVSVKEGASGRAVTARGSIGLLEFATDFRQCWTSPAFLRGGIRKLTIPKEGK